MAMMPRYSYYRNADGELDVTPMPIIFWVLFFGFVGGLMLYTFFSSVTTEVVDEIKVEEVQND